MVFTSIKGAQSSYAKKKLVKSEVFNKKSYTTTHDTQMDDQDKATVWVGGLAWKTTWQALKDHMAQAGTVEFVKLMTDEWTGRSRGMALVRFESQQQAQLAVSNFNESELEGRNIQVDACFGKKAEEGSSKSTSKGFGKGGKGKGKGKGKEKGKHNRIDFFNDDEQEQRSVWVGNLGWKVNWQALKDHMGQAGTVDFVKILTEDGTNWGRSRGIAFVRYSTLDEARSAIAILKESELQGRNIQVDVLQRGKPQN